MIFKGHKGAYFVGALLVALALTGGVFAFGFINSSATLGATIASTNFADVSQNSGYTGATWTGFGFFKGSIPGAPIFNVQPAAGYTGDLAVSVSLGNADLLAKRYRVLALKLQMINAAAGTANTTVDINEDGSANIADDWVILSLDNGSVSMFPNGSTNLTVNLISGFYITNVVPNGGWQGSASPDLFCEVAQR